MTIEETRVLKTLENYLNKLAGNKEGCCVSDETKQECKHTERELLKIEANYYG